MEMPLEALAEAQGLNSRRGYLPGRHGERDPLPIMLPAALTTPLADGGTPRGFVGTYQDQIPRIFPTFSVLLAVRSAPKRSKRRK
jgi:hypothetical protein